MVINEILTNTRLLALLSLHKRARDLREREDDRDHCQDNA